MFHLRKEHLAAIERVFHLDQVEKMEWYLREVFPSVSCTRSVCPIANRAVALARQSGIHEDADVSLVAQALYTLPPVDATTEQKLQSLLGDDGIDAGTRARCFLDAVMVLPGWNNLT